MLMINILHMQYTFYDKPLQSSLINITTSNHLPLILTSEESLIPKSPTSLEGVTRYGMQKKRNFLGNPFTLTFNKDKEATDVID